MLRTALTLVALLILSGCNFHWDGPVEVTQTDQNIQQCLKIDTDSIYLYCYKDDRYFVKIPWQLVGGLKTL